MSVFFLSTILLGNAQFLPDANLDSGVRPGETYDRANENVSIGSGNLNLSIPLVHLPGRHGTNLDIDLTYNSKMWTPVASLPNPQNADIIDIGWTASSSSGASAIGAAGWQLNIPTLYAQSVYTPGTTNGSNTSYTQCTTNFVAVMGDGSQYGFPVAQIDCTQTSNNGYGYKTLDFPYTDTFIDCDGLEPGVACGVSGSGILLDLTHAENDSGFNNYAVLHLSDGSQVLFPLPSRAPNTPGVAISAVVSALTDSNGNTTNIASTASGWDFTDTLNRTVTYAFNAGGSGIDAVTYKNSAGAPQTIQINQPSTKIPSPTFTTPTTGSYIQTITTGQISSLLSSIVLPNGLSYDLAPAKRIP